MNNGGPDQQVAAADAMPLPKAVTAQLLDAFPAHAALLDSTGVIVMVNNAWRCFGVANVLADPASVVGTNYLEVCDAAVGDCAADARWVASGIRGVLAGTFQSFSHDYACHSPTEQRWFRVTVSPLVHGAWRGVAVSHLNITDLVGSEIAAREGEARYRAVFDASPVPMWVYDAATLRFLAVNDATCAVYGHTRDEFLRMTINDCAGDVEAVPGNVRQSKVPTASSHRGLFRFRRHDGRWVTLEIFSHAVGWGGTPARLVVALDVTARVSTQLALEESEQRFRQMTSAISEVFWLTNADGSETLYVSPAYEAIWGRPVDELYRRPRHWLEAVHPEDRERVMREGLAPHESNLEYRIVRPDGEIRWILDRGFTVHDAEGNLIRKAGVARDITERIASQAQLRLLQNAVAQLNDLVVITDAEPIDGDGPRIVFVNAAFERRTGYAREEVIGRTPRLLQGPETQRSELARIRRALERWEPVRAEVINYTKDGDPFWLEIQIAPVANPSGRFTHWVAVERDITDRKLVEQHLQQAQRLESLGQLTGGVAHDFNNLLTVILGNAELLRDELDRDSLPGQLTAMIEGAAQRGADLTRRLLAFARRQPLAPTVVDANRLVSGMDDLLRRTLGDRIAIELHEDLQLWLALVDSSQLENAILNLAINARDAMPSGGRLSISTGNVRVDEADVGHPGVAPGEYVLIAVDDTGCGIAPQHRARLFEPFFTTKEKGKGTGLGLAMVYGFVRQSNGHVTIDSVEGEGTTVRIYLPRHDASVEDAQPAVAAAPAGHGELVLLVEDDALVRDFGRRLLLELGYRVLEVPDGDEALRLLSDHPEIDLLFTDISMPGSMNGWQLAEAARAARPGLPVLYTTGYSEQIVAESPEVTLLAKPFRRAELAAKLKEAMQAARATEQ